MGKVAKSPAAYRNPAPKGRHAKSACSFEVFRTSLPLKGNSTQKLGSTLTWQSQLEETSYSVVDNRILRLMRRSSLGTDIQ